MISSLVQSTCLKWSKSQKQKNKNKKLVGNVGSFKQVWNCSVLKTDRTLLCFKLIWRPEENTHRTQSGRQRCVYLWYSWVVDLYHYVADQLQNKKSSIQTSKVELVLHVIIQNLPPADHLLHTHSQMKVSTFYLCLLHNQRRPYWENPK